MDKREAAARAKVAEAVRKLQVVLAAVEQRGAKTEQRGAKTEQRGAKTEQRRAMIAEQFEPGASATKVARSLGLSVYKTLADFRAMGLPVRKPGAPAGNPSRFAARNLQIIAAAQSEPPRTLDDIGRQFGLTRERVRQIIDRHGVKKRKVRPPGPRPNPAIAERNAQNRAAIAERKAARQEKARANMATAAELNRRGLPGPQVAREMGVGIMTGYKYIWAARDAGML